MLCYSRWVRHVCFGINGPITAPLSNGPWQRSGIAWSHLLLSFTFPYINWPITEGENMFYLRHYITVARCGFVHYILKPIMQYFFQIVYCHWSPKRNNFYNFGLSVTILDFQWLFCFKVVGEMVKNVTESDFWSNWHCQPFCEQKWPGSHIYHNSGRWRSFNLSSNCIDLKWRAMQ